MINEWIHIFLYPYQNRSFFQIFLESSAATFSILSVIFAQKNNIWLYPIGIGSTVIYCYITFINSLYGDCLINLYYTGMSLYGWYVWKYRKKEKNFSISFSDKKDYCYTALLFVSTCILSTIVYYYFNNGKLQSNSDWVDVLTTGIFFSGMYQMSMKKVESWIFWIIGNIISVPLYFFKGLFLTGFLFIFLFLLAIGGYVLWKKKVSKKIIYH
ncbi:nicotinamide riboside transporter PnuC [Blattabacterium cuenoti]|uniref:nicotinamide riboside transporter PnuC n=1 Tax=Blattabacterium cuenoti TaxID=1653831 RepID=UPI00293BF2F5|nr:nicotinamide riboside transporter PnuC [Blattabacterium cuenoti]